ncbi:MAG: zinc ABC transporter substrate-binding protein [Spirochaetes bacterium]|nr:zinc ABC transporter substrate-binding protein [Spirochaetota bacterium]MBU1079086.1 zinc ABC transporter substrate-binding protein [Spirochaetota bacterium]
MRSSRTFAAVAALAVLAAATAFAMGSRESLRGAPAVVVSIQPQAYFVERIAGGRFRPVVLVGPGQSPHSYEPTPRQMADLSSATLWLTIGAEFERSLVPKVSALYPGLRIADTTSGVVYRDLSAHSHEGEPGKSPEAIGEAKGGRDPHVWLGRQAVKAMAASIRDALTASDPGGTSAYSANHDAFARDVDAVYDELARTLEPLRGATVFVYHPSFGYLLDEFGIEQEAVETGGKEPTQKALAALIAEARADGAKVVFVQAQFPSSAAKAIADSIGGVVVTIDPLARDWLDNLRRIGTALRESRP